MSEAKSRVIDPAQTFVEIDGKQVSMRELATAHDQARAQHLVRDLVPIYKDAALTQPGFEVKESGAGEGQFTIQGHAAVFNVWSLRLGWFYERVDPGAFDMVLSTDPDVHANWQHDMRWILGRTRNKTLELRPDERGLHIWDRVAPTSYSEDLRTLLDRGDVDQMSWAAIIGEDLWEIHQDGDDEEIRRTILRVEELFDVCVCAQGAYPTTDVSIVRDLLNSLHNGRSSTTRATTTAAQDDPADAPAPSHEASEAVGGSDALARLQARTRSRVAVTTHKLKGH